jgi:MFS family permease
MTGVDDAKRTVSRSPARVLARPLMPYAEIFRIPGAWRFSAAGLIGRMPMSMFGLGTVLLISAETGKYGIAGAVAAAGSFGYAFVTPPLARLMDARGQRRILLPLLAVFALSTAALILTVEFQLPTWAFFVPGALAGSALPSLGTLVRARWSVLLAGSPRLHAAFSFESVADELCFIVGPAAVTLLATEVVPASGVGVAAALCVAGTLWFAAERGTEPPVAGPVHRHGSGGPRVRGAAAPGLVVLAPVYLLLGAMFVSVDLSTVAFAQHFGHKPLAGFILGTYAFGSATGGLWYGSRQWRAPLGRRFAITLVLTVTGVATFWAQPNLLTLTCGIYLCGLTIAPTLIAGFSLLEAQAYPGRRTEAISWLSSGIAVGVAAGASVVGFVIDSRGPRAGYAFAAVCGVASALTCLLGMRRLQAGETPDCGDVLAVALRVLAGQGEHFIDVPGRVVVSEDGRRQRRRVSRAVGAQHARGRGHGVQRVHDVRRACLAEPVDPPGGPRRRHELHRAEGARARRAVVGAVAALDLPDRRQHRPGHARAVSRGGLLVQHQVVGRYAGRRHVRGHRELAGGDHGVGHQVPDLPGRADDRPYLRHQRAQGRTRGVDQHRDVLHQA